MADVKSLPLIVVAGATGNQGGSVVDALLKEKKWRIRGLTRNANSDAAKALAQKKIEVVECDLKNLSQVQAAFKGAQYAFAVTNFWDKDVLQDHNIEITQGKNMVQAASEQKDFKHFIWSGLPDVKTISGLNVPHFTNKHTIEKQIRELKLPATFVYAGFYMSNFEGFQFVKKEGDTLYFQVPMRADIGLPLTDISETGYYVSTILNHPSTFLGEVVVMAPEYITLSQVISTYQRVTGEKAAYRRLSIEDVKANYGYVGEELANMFLWFDRYGYAAGVDISANSKHFPASNTWETYLRTKKLKF